MADMTACRSLVGKRDFLKVYTEGVKKVGRFLVVYLLPADDSARAVVASKRVGGAVQRNRAKRLLRVALRTGALASAESVVGIQKRFFPEPEGHTANRIEGEIPEAQAPDASPTGLWVVLVARKAILDTDSRTVREELDTLLGCR